MKMDEVLQEDMCVLVAPDGSWQAMTLAPDFPTCLAVIKLLHKAGLSQSFHELVKVQGFKILPVKVTILQDGTEQDGTEQDAFNKARAKL